MLIAYHTTSFKIILKTNLPKMKITTNIKPLFFVASTKKELVQTITRGCCYSIFANGNCWTLDGFPSFKTVRAYNIEKHRKKVKRTRVNGKTVSTVVSPNRWFGYVYTIPTDLLKATGLKVIQTERTFFLSKKK